MNKNTKKKHKFSHYVHKVDFENDKLVVSGRRWVISFFLLLCLLGTCFAIYKMSLDGNAPTFIIVSACFGGLIFGYAFWDVALSKSYLEYSPLSGYLLVVRKDMRKSFRYKGYNDQSLKVIKRRENRRHEHGGAMRVNNMSIEREPTEYMYSVHLVFENEEVKIPFMLTTVTLREEGADEKVEEWKQKLRLNNQ